MPEELRQYFIKNSTLFFDLSDEKSTKISEMNLPNGCYQVVWQLRNSFKSNIGKFVEVIFQPGFYCYSGSAQKGLKNRILRHLSKQKKLYWHIDYLSSISHFEPIFIAVYANVGSECKLNRQMANEFNAVFPIPNFGSSDCKNKCISHLSFITYCN